MSDFRKGDRVTDGYDSFGTFLEYRVIEGYSTRNGRRTCVVKWDDFPRGEFCGDDHIRKIT